MHNIDSNTKIYGIIGYPLGHTFSPAMHNAAFKAEKINAVYLAFAVKNLINLKTSLKKLKIQGLSITIPHKIKINRILDKISPLAVQIGSVNTIYWNKEGLLEGHNTDGIGAIEAIKETRFNINKKNILIIGTGGSARAIAMSLLYENPQKIGILSRNINNSEKLIKNLKLVKKETIFENFLYKDSKDAIGVRRKKTVLLEKGQSMEVLFPIAVKNSTADKTVPMQLNGKISVANKTNILRDSVSFTLPVVNLPVTEAFSLAGYTEKSITEKIRIPEKESIFPHSGSLDVSLSSTALTGLKNGFDFYNSNPYFCLEQRSSALLLAITSGKLLKSFAHKPPERDGYDFKTIEQLFSRDLGYFQNSDGGFRTWKESSSKSSPYLTAYAVFVMQVMKEQGLPVSEEIYGKAFGWLKKYISRPDKSSLQYLLENAAFIQYVLIRGGQGNTNVETALLKYRDRISLRAKGYLALSIAARLGSENYNDNPELASLMQEFRNSMVFNTRRIDFREPVYPSYGATWYSDGSTMAVLLRVFMQLDKKSPLIPQMVQAATSGQAARYWNNSHSSGNLAYSLWQYHKLYEEKLPDYNAVIKLGSSVIASESFKGRNDLFSSRSLPVNSLAGPGLQDLTFGKSGTGRLYYTATLNYAPVKMQKARDEGIEIRREKFTLSPGDVKSGKAAADLTRGAMYLYRITVSNPKPVYYFVLDSPLPSNVETVNTSFQTVGASYGRFLQQKNSSSSGWWNTAPVYEYRDSKVVVTQDYLEPGVHEYFYIGRAATPGNAYTPPAHAFGMYEPEIFGRTGSERQVIK